MRPGRRVLIAAGGVGMVWAVLGALTDPDIKIFGVLLFLGVVLVAHDAILLPTVIGVGALVDRLPARLRVGVRVALLVGLAVAVIALPLMVGRRA